MGSAIFFCVLPLTLLDAGGGTPLLSVWAHPPKKQRESGQFTFTFPDYEYKFKPLFAPMYCLWQLEGAWGKKYPDFYRGGILSRARNENRCHFWHVHVVFFSESIFIKLESLEQNCARTIGRRGRFCPRSLLSLQTLASSRVNVIIYFININISIVPCLAWYIVCFSLTICKLVTWSLKGL